MYEIIDSKEWETIIIPFMTRITLLNGEGLKKAFEFLTVDDQGRPEMYNPNTYDSN